MIEKTIPLSNRLVNCPSELRGMGDVWVGLGRNEQDRRVPRNQANQAAYWAEPREGDGESWPDLCDWETIGSACFCLDWFGEPVAREWDGLGYVAPRGHIMLDLDDCRDPETGEPDQDALELMQRFQTYWEVSDSGTGYHGHVLGHGVRAGTYTLPHGGGLEVKTKGLFMMTLNPAGPCRDLAWAAGDLSLYLGSLRLVETSGRALCATGTGMAGERIGEGTRNNTLAGYAMSLWARGLGFTAVEAELIAINEHKCDPPLDDREVIGIVRSTERTYNRTKWPVENRNVALPLLHQEVGRCTSPGHIQTQEKGAHPKRVSTTTSKKWRATTGDIDRSSPGYLEARQRIKEAHGSCHKCRGPMVFVRVRGQVHGECPLCSDPSCECAAVYVSLWGESVRRTAPKDLLRQILTESRLKEILGAAKKRLERAGARLQYFRTGDDLVEVFAEGIFDPEATATQSNLDEMTGAMCRRRARAHKGERLHGGSYEWGCPTIERDPAEQEDREILGTSRVKVEVGAKELQNYKIDCELNDPVTNLDGTTSSKSILIHLRSPSDLDIVRVVFRIRQMGRRPQAIRHPVKNLVIASGYE